MGGTRFVELCDGSPGAGRRWIPVSRFTTSSGTAALTGVMEARKVRATYALAGRDARAKTGYQRELSRPRVDRLVRELRENRLDLLTTILVSLRDFDSRHHVAERHGRLYFRHDDHRLYVVDGQHRVEALARLVDEDDDRWGDFLIPFVCLLGATEDDERRQFHVVNTTARSLPRDLALDLLKQRTECEPRLVGRLIEAGGAWKVVGQRLVEQLATTRLWRGRIRFPGEPKGETAIGSARAVSSLRTPLTSPYFGALTTENQVRILDAYWRGIEKVLPECFVSPGYLVQAPTGVDVLHGLLVSVVEHVRSYERSVVEPAVYADVLNTMLSELEGLTAAGDSVRGPEFWREGAEGAASSYSSNAGRRVLTTKLLAMLPRLEVA